MIRLWLSTQTRQASRWLRQFCFRRESISPGLSFVIAQELASGKTICHFLHNYANLQLTTDNTSKKSAQVPVVIQRMFSSSPFGKTTWFLSLPVTKLACFRWHHIAPIQFEKSWDWPHPVLQPRMNSFIVFDLSKTYWKRDLLQFRHGEVDPWPLEIWHWCWLRCMAKTQLPGVACQSYTCRAWRGR